MINIVERSATLEDGGKPRQLGSEHAPAGVRRSSEADGSPRVVRANLSHLDAIVRIHLDAFEGFFLESMGERFLKELYRGFIVSRSGLCLVALNGSGTVGFIVGTTQPEGFFRSLLRDRWHSFVLAGGAALARHPIRVGKKFVSALRYRGEKPADVPNALLLSSIGVDPKAKRQGIGKILLAAFCDGARATGVPVVFLTTDRDNNSAVNEFYLANGFTLHSSFLKERARWMNLYTRSLVREAAG